MDGGEQQTRTACRCWHYVEFRFLALSLWAAGKRVRYLITCNKLHSSFALTIFAFLHPPLDLLANSLIDGLGTYQQVLHKQFPEAQLNFVSDKIYKEIVPKVRF